MDQDLRSFLDTFHEPAPTGSARPRLRAMLQSRARRRGNRRNQTTAPAPVVEAQAGQDQTTTTAHHIDQEFETFLENYRSQAAAPAPVIDAGPADRAQPDTTAPQLATGANPLPLPDTGAPTTRPETQRTDRRMTGSNPPDPEEIVTPELSPSLYAARTAAAIAREAANREIAAEQAIEEAATARLRYTRARRAAEAAERDISRGEIFRRCARSAREACDRAQDEADKANRCKRRALAEWRQSMRELGDAALYGLSVINGDSETDV